MKNNAKRALMLLLAAAMLLSLCGCTRGGEAGADWQEKYDLGVRYLSKGNYEQAIAAFTAAIEIDAKKAPAYVGRADAYIAIGETAENYNLALADYKEALALDDSLEEAWERISDIYLWLDEHGHESPSDAPATPATPVAPVTPQPTEPVQGELDYNTERILTADGYVIDRLDHSIRNEQGEPIIKLWYDLVQITDGSAAGADINKALRSDYERVFTPERLEEYAQYVNDSFFDSKYLYTLTARVTNNQGGVFSVEISTEWYMGGVYNADQYGLTYDLNSGESLSLKHLDSRAGGNLLSRLREAVLSYMDSTGGWFTANEAFDAREKVRNYQFEDFTYYIENNEIIICIKTYELGPGASGAHKVRTGIYISSNGGTAAGSNVFSSGKAYPAELLGRTVNDFVAAYGDYKADFGLETPGIISDKFPLLKFAVDTSSYTMSDGVARFDGRARIISISDQFGSYKETEIVKGLYTHMTYPEIKEAVGNEITLPKVDGNGSLEFKYRGYLFHYFWADLDPYLEASCVFYIELAQETKQTDKLEYEVTRQEHSIYDASGKYGAKLYYDLPQITSQTWRFADINAMFNERYEEYLRELNQIDYVASAKTAMNYNVLYGFYVNTNVYTSGKWLSVLYSTRWYMGREAYWEYRGVTVNLETGLSPWYSREISDGESTKEAVMEYAEAQGWNMEQVRYTLSLYGEDDFNYYVKDGQIILLFDAHELTDEAVQVPYMKMPNV